MRKIKADQLKYFTGNILSKNAKTNLSEIPGRFKKILKSIFPSILVQKKKESVLESLNLGESDGAIRIIYFIIQFPRLTQIFFFGE